MRRCQPLLLSAALSLLVSLGTGCQGPDAELRERALQVARDALALEDVDRYDRVVAAGILLSGGSVEGEEVLLDALTSGAELARQAAVGAVLTVRGPRAIQWFERHSTQSPELTRSVLEGLRITPRTDAVALIESAIRTGQPNMQVAALDAAANSRNPELLPVVEEYISKLDDPRMRAYAIYAASSLGSAKIPAMVEPLLRASGELQREIAAACLALEPTEWSRDALEKLARDPSPRVRIAASASRARQGVREAKDYLRGQVLGNDERLASIAAGALRRSSGDIILELANLVVADGSVDEIAAGRVIEALGWARDMEARETLARGVEPGQAEHLRLQSLWAVGWRGRAEERELAAGALDDTSLPVRVMAAWAVIYNQDGGYEEGTGALSPTQARL